jgi:phosphoglycolate phosphatase-like HAD superfamily hydrolase
MSARPLVVYVDVDDTLVRSAGTKRIPVPAVVEHVRALKAQGAELYCWSTGGADYARRSAEELGIADCFAAFLPKPHVLLDDQPVGEWRGLLSVHPAECRGQTAEGYRRRLGHPAT